MPDYGSAAYWDERYAADENASFDWCVAGWRGGLATSGTPDGLGLLQVPNVRRSETSSAAVLALIG